MEQEIRRKGPRSPSEESDSSHRRRAKKYERSTSRSPRRRYRRSRSRSGSREIRRKESSSRSSEWKSTNMQSNNKSQANSTSYPAPVLNQYNTAPPPEPNTSQPPPTIQAAYNQNYGNYNYPYGQTYEYGYQQQAPAVAAAAAAAAAANYRNDYPPHNWQGNVAYYNQQQPPPTIPAQDSSRPAMETAAAVAAAAAAAGIAPPGNRAEEAKKEAIAAELKQQKATLAKQREEYMKKISTLQKKLEILRKQCDEIGKEGGRDNQRIIKENQELQVEIQNKVKSIHNVIDMLTGIIGDKATVDSLKMKQKNETAKLKDSPEEEYSLNKKSPGDSSDESKPSYNFVHYDPEMHWCKVCDIFPKTAKEYLNHLHCNEHKEVCTDRKLVDMPWHDVTKDVLEKETPYYPGLPTKRTPIKGLQFFSPATAWYCKLCNAWIGDLHCASLHLKSRRHSENYAHFVDQNPHWETDWMADREKALSDSKSKQLQMEFQKHKEDTPSKPKKSKKSKKNKKKSKKRKMKSSNSESSSETENTESEREIDRDHDQAQGHEHHESNLDHDASRSIRVAMRNKIKSSQPPSEQINDIQKYHKNWSENSQPKEESPATNDVMENNERQLINSLRDKLKAKQQQQLEQERKEMSRKNHQMEEEEEEVNENENIKDEQNNYPNPSEYTGWGAKDAKNFWIKKDEDKKPEPVKQEEKEIPKPHMGFWTKQQVNVPVKNEKVESSKDDRDRYRDDHRESRDKYDKYDKYDRYDRRDSKYRYRDDRYDHHRRGGRDRGREYYDSRSRRRDSGGSPSWRGDRRDYRDRDDSPRRGYDKYKSRDDDSGDERKNGDKSKKGQQKKSSAPPVKGKLPFIGRLPLLKKKDDPRLPEKEVAPVPYTQTKFEDTPKVPTEIINPPGVVHVTKLATPISLPSNIAAVKAQQQMKILVAPPPPVLNDKNKKEQSGAVDMEIEDQNDDADVDKAEKKESLPKLPNTSLPPPGYQPPKPAAETSTGYPSGPPPPFVTNFLNPPKFDQTMTQPMQYMPMQMTMPPPMYANPPPPIPSSVETVAEVTDIPEPSEKRPDGQPLPEDLQEALDIIFPKDEAELARMHAENDDNNIMYGSMYSMLGCAGYGPELMEHPPLEIIQSTSEVEQEPPPGPEDFRMLGIDEGDTIL